MKDLTVYFIVLLSVLCLSPFCVGQNNGTATNINDAQVSDAGVDEKSSLQKGMDPVFKMYHKFLDTIMPYNFYDEGDAPFSVQDLIHITKNDDYTKLQEDWQDIVKSFGGFAACMICGLLFVVFMPIVGLIYCCCHCCCNKCGGTREQHDPKHAKCKRVTYTTLLLIFTTFMLAGAIITFLGADLLHQSLKNEDNKGLMGGMDTSLGHLQTFVNDTLTDIKTEARETIIDRGLNGILKEITETALTTVDKVKSVINATSLLDQAEDVGKAAETALADLNKVSESLTDLNELQANVTTTLDNVKTSVTTACSGNTTFCPGIDLSTLKFVPNFGSLGNLSTELNKVQEADNITGLVNEARREFDEVSNSVNTSVAKQIQSAQDQIDTLTTDISQELNNLDGKSAGFVDAMADGRTFAVDEEEQIRKVGNYIWYACIGLACAVLLVVVFYYLGVLFGLCGERPTTQAPCCNKGSGANLLCAGICFSFLFCWILMLVVILTFTLGGLSYTMACKFLNQGVERISVFEDVVSEGFGWNISNAFNTTNLTIGEMFENCKQDEGVYTALNLKNFFDIDTELDISNVEDQVNEIINTSSINIGNITLISTSLKAELEEFTASNLTAVNYTQYFVEAEKSLFSVDLNDTINKLTTAASVPNIDANLNATLNAAVLDLTRVRDVQQPELLRHVKALKTSMESLQENSDITVQITGLINSIEASQLKFNTEKDQIVKNQLSAAATGILSNIRATVNETKDAIKYDIGKCRPLYDAAQSVVHSVCVITVDPLNAIWFGLGWSLFFYIPSFIFAALLASLYKRPEKYEEQRKPDFDDVNTPYSGYDNGYQGGRNEEQYPLTRVDNSRSRDKVGSNNYAYEGRDHEPDSRYHRDAHGAQPYHVGYPNQGAGGDGRGSAYATPYAGSQDPYDGYGPSPPPRYDDVAAHGRNHGKNHGGYPKLRNY